jgi:DNA-binding transcriptional regulator YdaS (Cro superfamily)
VSSVKNQKSLSEQIAEATKKALPRKGLSELAKQLDTTAQRLVNWRDRDHKIPAEFVIRIEKITGISRHELRPDVYPIEESYPTPAA